MEIDSSHEKVDSNRPLLMLSLNVYNCVVINLMCKCMFMKKFALHTYAYVCII